MHSCRDFQSFDFAVLFKLKQMTFQSPFPDKDIFSFIQIESLVEHGSWMSMETAWKSMRITDFIKQFKTIKRVEKQSRRQVYFPSKPTWNN